jgi:hypothetical protein
MLALGFPAAFASPILTLHAPTSVGPDDPFQLRIYLDGLASPGHLGADELLAFGFRLDLSQMQPPGLGFLTFDGYSLGSFFQDDTRAVFPGESQVLAGSAFPGVTGGHILLATVDLSAHGAGPGTSWLLGFDLAFMQTNPNAGIFTLFGADLGESLGRTTHVRIAAPDPGGTGGLLALGLGTMLVMRTNVKKWLTSG